MLYTEQREPAQVPEFDLHQLTLPGRKPSAAEGCFAGELVEAELPLLAQARGTTQDVKRITERHHALARALAMGMSEAEAGTSVGLLPSRVSVLKASPAFQEILSLYRANKDREFQDTVARLAGVAHDAVLELADRLEQKPEEITVGQLIELSKLGLDRTGLGPTSTQKVEVRDLSSRIEAGRQRALAARAAPPLIEDAEVLPPRESHG